MAEQRWIFLLNINLYVKVFSLEQAMVGAGPGKSHTFQGGCDYFQRIYNDTQNIQDLGSHYLYCFFSLFFHASFYPCWSCFKMLSFLKENNFDQIICICYNIPNHCSQNSHERLVMSPFFGETVAATREKYKARPSRLGHEAFM